MEFIDRQKLLKISDYNFFFDGMMVVLALTDEEQGTIELFGMKLLVRRIINQRTIQNKDSVVYNQ